MFKRLSKTSWKLFLAGGGMSFSTGKYFGESILVGALTGIVVVGFRYMIDAGEALARYLAPGMHNWKCALLPCVGAVLGYLLIKRFDSLEHARGTDSAIRAYHHKKGYVTGTVIPIKSTASVLTVASGGSAGYEGPVTLLGAACGSQIARWFNLSRKARRLLMCAGLSAGISALFQAPLSGAIFGAEILYSSSDLEYEALLPCFTASAVSYTVYASFFGWCSLFDMPDCNYETSLGLLPYFALAFVITWGARLYIIFFNATERAFAANRLPGVVKVAFGGLITGGLLYFYPEIAGPGYNVIRFALDPMTSFSAMKAFALFFFLKIVATSFTVGSGGSGGVFAPAIACGGALGAATGIFFLHILPESAGIQPAAFALVGMAGFLASTVRIPLSAIVMVAEISGNHSLLLPAMWVCGVSFWLNNDWSLYRSQVHNRESSPVHM